MSKIVIKEKNGNILLKTSKMSSDEMIHLLAMNLAKGVKDLTTMTKKEFKDAMEMYYDDAK